MAQQLAAGAVADQADWEAKRGRTPLDLASTKETKALILAALDADTASALDDPVQEIQSEEARPGRGYGIRLPLSFRSSRRASDQVRSKRQNFDPTSPTVKCYIAAWTGRDEDVHQHLKNGAAVSGKFVAACVKTDGTSSNALLEPPEETGEISGAPPAFMTMKGYRTLNVSPEEWPRVQEAKAAAAATAREEAAADPADPALLRSAKKKFIFAFPSLKTGWTHGCCKFLRVGLKF